MKKGPIALFIISCLLCVSAPVIKTEARAVPRQMQKADVTFDMYTASSNTFWDGYTLDNIQSSKRLFGAPSNSAFWNQFSDTYFYQRMNAEQRGFYDRLKAAADSMLFSDMNAQTQRVNNTDYLYNTFPVTNTSVETVLPGVSCGNLSSKDAMNIYIIFSNANPQYYFLEGAMIFVNNGMAYPCIYQQYANGATRSMYSEQFMSILNEWIAQVIQGQTPLERERNIYELLAAKLSYYNGSWDEHQSSATAVFQGKTVCAGYAECFAMLAKACGIECLVITSSEHEWNQVRLGNYWYNVDLTLDDNGGYPDWAYFNKSDRTFAADGSHNADAVYKTLGMPSCPYDYGQEPDSNNVVIAPNTNTPIIVNPDRVTKESMYRLLNSKTGEHLFTRDLNEKNTLQITGWTYEGVAWNSPVANTIFEPVYRVFNPRSGEHHYTMDLNEKNTLVQVYGWRDEGVKWYSYDRTGVPVYRLYNPRLKGIGSHHYTTSIEEKTALIQNAGWRDEGICWYGVQ